MGEKVRKIELKKILEYLPLILMLIAFFLMAIIALTMY